MKKNCTDLEQSKKLAEILPIESADMYWWATSKRYYIEAMDDGDFNEREGHIRAWSLAALLDVLPSSTLDSSNVHYYMLHCMERISGWHENPIDACYEMIIGLHGLKML